SINDIWHQMKGLGVGGHAMVLPYLLPHFLSRRTTERIVTTNTTRDAAFGQTRRKPNVIVEQKRLTLVAACHRRVWCDCFLVKLKTVVRQCQFGKYTVLFNFSLEETPAIKCTSVTFTNVATHRVAKINVFFVLEFVRTTFDEFSR